MCAIFRDEAPYLREWVDFHLKQGVQHFYLYNNLSTDDPYHELTDYIASNTVEIIEWPYEHENLITWNNIQCKAYMDCVDKIKKKVKWCAFMDVDEFLFCPSGLSICKFLEEYSAYGG